MINIIRIVEQIKSFILVGSSNTSSVYAGEAVPEFDFEGIFFICSEAIVNQSHVSKISSDVCNEYFRNLLLNLLRKRLDDFAIYVLNRIADMPCRLLFLLLNIIMIAVNGYIYRYLSVQNIIIFLPKF